MQRLSLWVKGWRDLENIRAYQLDFGFRRKDKKAQAYCSPGAKVNKNPAGTARCRIRFLL